MMHAKRKAQQQTHNKLFSQRLNEKQSSCCILPWGNSQDLFSVTGTLSLKKILFYSIVWKWEVLGVHRSYIKMVLETLPYGGSAFFFLRTQWTRNGLGVLFVEVQGGIPFSFPGSKVTGYF